ncbi:DUF1080 domain-containing protein [Parabacteroides sp. PF5-9]|uniref:3-keto-disaccharide hydrolase n=1 Tax=Parabacteroides sp. PF5-9 TaxID=1742404 RepID=UPI002475274E|nr:DUF1080 domain-containing protein [Parabacteroides sp. PF5-9]MDH6357891.1 hypothetical protein [Parabacteroides sp. PF5-9]
MHKIIYFLSASLFLLNTMACSNKKTTQNSDQATMDPISLYNQVDWSSTNVLADSEKANGWISLFDGKSGNGWHGYNQTGIPECWAIEDGSLTMNMEGGGENTQDLITNKAYKSFVLSLEYKMTKGANSGVLFQVKEDPRYTYAYETGPEFQVIDHESWPDPLEDVQINGSNYAMYPPMERPFKNIGEWNQLMLIVDGNDVTQLLNGVVVVKYTKYSDEWTKLRDSGKWSAYPDYAKYDEGHISLQNHGTKVWYRNIKIKELK